MDVVVSRAKYECLLFDMDDTLYPLSSGLNLACRNNIQNYMMHHLQIDESIAPEMCLDLYKEYGTTMAGLKALGYEFDNDEFHAYIHGKLPYETLKPDPVLKNLLQSLPQQKLILTNADKAHATKVLSRLDVEDCFERIICFETLNPPVSSIDRNCDDYITTNKSSELGHAICSESDSENNSIDYPTENNSADSKRILCKPSLEAMETAIRIANIDPERTIFFDDSVRNIAAAKLAGLHTVIVGTSTLVPGADHALESIHNIRKALPELWEDEDQLDMVLSPTRGQLGYEFDNDEFNAYINGKRGDSET